MSSNVTMSFNDIFPSYNEWREFTTSEKIVAESIDADRKFNEFCYKILFREFSHQNIRYDTPYAFMQKLANVYENRFNKYKKEKEIIDEFYKMTLEDMRLVTFNLSNEANNPNTMPLDPTKPLNFISFQTYQNVTSGKLQSYLNALNNMPSLNIDNFLRKYENKYDVNFYDLFMNIQPNIEYYYNQGE